MGASFDFDLFVIGGGSGGVRAARTAAGLGARVALAEGGALGGTCVNVGCIPKKLYGFAAGYAASFEEARGYGWSLPGTPLFDWDTLKAGRRQEITRLNGVYQRLLAGSGVELVAGWARLDGPHTVVVGERRFHCQHILIASGGVPRVPDVPGHALAVNSDDMFDLPQLPKQLLVVGGGYIACEFASIFAGLGSQVTLVHRGPHLLAGFDRETAHLLEREMAEHGVELRLNTTIDRLARPDGHTRITARLSGGATLEADTVLHAIGRLPRTEGLGLDTAGIELDARGAIVVDAHYRTNVPSVYAVGDVSSRLHLTPVALAEAMVVVDQLFGPGKRRMQYEFIPTAVFTHPQLATCGDTEAEAIERLGADHIAVYASDFKSLRHSLSGRSTRTFVKLIVDTRSDRVIGLHLVGEDAAEIVQGFAVAMNAGATKAEFDATLGVHPTVAEELVTMRSPRPRP